ncbi:MAG: flagellar basal body L-ring protein FlgH [Candidatus Brocadiia bacterium]
MSARIPALAILLAVLPAGPASADSLWPGSEQPRPGWFSDLKARRVGDIVTILIDEEAKATTDLSQSHSQATETGGAIKKIQNVLGINKPDPAATTTTTAAEAGLPAVEWEASRKHDSTAKTESKEELELRIAAAVKEVLPNGNLLIEATRQVRHGRDVRLVCLSGIVRPADITAQNTVRSEHIAQARMSYEGRGPAMRVRNKGFFAHVIDFVWPF